MILTKFSDSTTWRSKTENFNWSAVITQNQIFLGEVWEKVTIQPFKFSGLILRNLFWDSYCHHISWIIFDLLNKVVKKKKKISSKNNNDEIGAVTMCKKCSLITK